MEVHVFKTEKLKSSILPLEKGNQLHVYRGHEPYVATKRWQRTHSRVNKQIEHLIFPLTLTLKVNTKFIYWNAYNVNVRKAKTSFKVWLNNQKTDAKKSYSITQP